MVEGREKRGEWVWDDFGEIIVKFGFLIFRIYKILGE